MKNPVAVVAAAAVLSVSGLHAADWPQWQGPDRTGLSKETGLAQATLSRWLALSASAFAIASAQWSTFDRNASRDFVSVMGPPRYCSGASRAGPASNAIAPLPAARGAAGIRGQRYRHRSDAADTPTSWLLITGHSVPRPTTPTALSRSHAARMS